MTDVTTRGMWLRIVGTALAVVLVGGWYWHAQGQIHDERCQNDAIGMLHSVEGSQEWNDWRIKRIEDECT